MKRCLLIAEKPSLMRTIKEVYEKHRSEIPYEIDFDAQSGHLLTLKLPDEIDERMKKYSWDTLPFFPDQHGGWQYKIVKQAKRPNTPTPNERYSKIKTALNNNNYDFIIHAGDPDQEGELLINIVLNSIGTTLPVKRFWSNDLTEHKVLEALQSLKDDRKDPQLVNLLKAGYVRQHKDYEFGMNISRAVSMKLNGVVGTGRVMTPMLSFVVARDHAIDTFQETKQYGVKLNYDKGFSGNLFSQKALSTDSDADEDQKNGIVWFDEKDDAQKIIDELGNTATVLTRTSTHNSQTAPKLFKLSTLQEALDKKGFKAKEVEAVVQSMYEKAITTYPRTSCEYMSGNEDFRGILNSLATIDELKPYVDRISDTDIERVKAQKKWINPKEHEKEGHSALTPTTKHPNFESLDPNEQIVYKLIAKRFIAMFLPPYEYETVEIITTNNNHSFKSIGKRTTAMGFKELFNAKTTDVELPLCAMGDVLNVTNSEIVEKVSKCPSHMTQGELIKICENPIKYLDDKRLKSLGKRLVIGTAATRGGIIEKLINKYHYIETFKEGKKEYIRSTEKGKAVIDNLKDLLICKPDMTGEWEIQLERIRSGEDTAEHVEAETKKDIVAMLEEIKTAPMVPFEHSVITTDYKCPICGANLNEYSWGYRCSKHDKDNPDSCNFSLSKEFDKWKIKLTKTDIETLLAGNPTQLKNFWSAKKEKFYPLRLYLDKDDNFKVKTKFDSRETPYKCPMCGSKMIKMGNEQHPGLKCTGDQNPNCTFVLWTKMFGKQLSDGHIKDLLEKGSCGPISGFKKKDGGTFSCKLKITSTGDVVCDFKYKSLERDNE